LIGLQEGELERLWSILQEHAPRWTDRMFWLEAEGRDVSVEERPDVAGLIATGSVAYACLGAQDLNVSGVRLPLVEMFLHTHEVQFFWWPGDAWNPARVSAFFSLLGKLLAMSPTARLRPDPRYGLAARRSLVRHMAVLVGADRCDVGPPQRA
jgi:hypothetical protein